MRRAHFLRDNRASDYPQQAIWFDTETEYQSALDKTLYHHLKFGYACYMRRHRNGVWSDEEWFKFTTCAGYWAWVVSHVRPKTKLYLFCHNTSFDLPVLDVFRYLPNAGFILRTAIIDAPPTILRFRRGSECIMILDTLNIWRMPLRFLGHEIGLEKLDMPDDNDWTSFEWQTYGRRDVEIIRSACLRWWKFLEDNDYGSFAPTLAAQSMRVFRHKYMRYKILIDDNKQALHLTRLAYHGARCECFRIGKFTQPLTLFDVNSMYPYVMSAYEYPYRLLSFTRYADTRDLGNWLKSYCICARVVLRTNRAFAAVREGHKLIFPVGEFECYLSTPELQYALLYSDILEVKECAVYEKAFLFTEMMTDLYARRVTAKRSGNRVAAFIYRLLMNSFYGKWGQNGGKWLEQDNIEDLSVKHWMEIDLVTNKVIHWRQFAGLLQRKGDEAESRDSFPAIAAHITAYGRMELFRIIGIAGADNVFYCDTDSVLTTEEGAGNLDILTDPEAMGKLSIKGKYAVAQIWGPKDYAFGEVRKTKGVRRDAIWFDDFHVEQALWCGLRGLIASGQTDKAITKRVNKHLKRIYDKGTVLADGRVLPLFLSSADAQ